MTTKPEAPQSPPTCSRGAALTLTPARLLVLALLVAGAFVVAIQRPAAASAEAPPLLFPWQQGVAWQTGIAGFHNTNDAIDFFPPDTPPSGTLHCEGGPGWVFEESAYWTLASAPGVVTHSGDAYVLIDHGNGWFSRYWHLSAYQVKVGDHVVAGQRLGHPSTLGECSTGPHMHYWVTGPNGETTMDIELSGRATTTIGIAEWIRETQNYDVGTPIPTETPVPSETPFSSDTPSPTDAVTAVPTDTPVPTPLPTETAAPTPEPPPPVGDANCDGTVTSLDAVFVLRYVAGIEETKCVDASDLDCDGAVTAADAVWLLERTSGLSREPAGLCASPSASGDDTPVPTPTDTPIASPSDTPTATGGMPKEEDDL